MTATRTAAYLAAMLAASATAGCREDRGDEAISLMEEMAEVFDKNKASCDKLGEALDAFIEKNQTRFDRIEAYDKGLTAEQRKVFEQTYGDRAERAMSKIMSPDVAACGENGKVQDALKKISPR
jgi:hypothetical protein